MQALILAGGKGTRLRPLTLNTPKPIVPICNRPFLLYQIETLRRAGITDITLSLSYQPHKIEQLLGDGSEFGVHLKYTVEPEPMGTAGAYKFAEEFIRERTVVFNGDILTDLDLDRVLRQHTERQAIATIVLTPVENPSAYGLVETESDGRVRRFLEKPAADEITTNMINAGTYVLEPGVLNIIPPNQNFSFEYNVFPEILRNKLPFYAYMPDADIPNYWIDIGTPARYLQAHHDLLSGAVSNIALPDPQVEIDATEAEVDVRSIIARNCVVKPGARITNSVLGEGCIIEERAVVRDSVLWAHTRVSTDAQVANSIIGRGCHVGRFASVNGYTVLGDKTSLTDYTQIGAAR